VLEKDKETKDEEVKGGSNTSPASVNGASLTNLDSKARED